ncbi:MAG: hypothetical protein JWP81_1273 [Ferruginibacter sp.]|nr:hypothetical protein [Ferruginibacter sp.]
MEIQATGNTGILKDKYTQLNHLTVAKKGIEGGPLLADDSFADQYIQLRKKEGRLYSDEVVQSLPVVSSAHPQYSEWRIRKRSSDRLLKYLRKKNTSPNILEIGCGNGWLTARMATVTKGKVWGIDINSIEIEQARRVFGSISNCRFIEGNIFSGVLEDNKFDFIIFAASIQYFPCLEEILNTALSFLTLQGEIHIMDSKLYQYKEISAAQQRSKAYFDLTGCPGLLVYYHHHCIDNLQGFQQKVLYDPNALLHKFVYPYHPFHWILIKNGYL